MFIPMRGSYGQVDRSSRSWVRKAINVLFLLFAYLMAAGAGFNGFVTKWGFHDMPDSDSTVVRYSFPKMLDQTADRPFVYRQLLPIIARGAESLIPAARREAVDYKIVGMLNSNMSLHHTFSRSSAMQPRFALEYLVVYTLTFLSFFVGLLLMRSVCQSVTGSALAGTLAPLAFAVVFPLLMSKNGYFYDYPEIMFMALGMWLALRDRWVALAIVTAIATLNKETYFLFAIALMPFMIRDKVGKRDLLKAVVLVLVGATVNLLVKHHYAGSPGEPIELHFGENLGFYFDPRSYLRIAINYGVVTPNEFHFVNIVLVVALVMRGWSLLSKPARQHIAACALINFPLFFLFCRPEELRNLSMLYTGLMLLIAVNLKRWIQSEAQAAPIKA